MLSWLAWASTVAVLSTYAYLARTGRPLAFHWANALGCWPVMFIEINTGAWQPLALTATFGALGFVGIVKEHRA